MRRFYKTNRLNLIETFDTQPPRQRRHLIRCVLVCETNNFIKISTICRETNNREVIRVNRLGKRLSRKTCESDIQIVRPGSDFPGRTPTRCEWKASSEIWIKILYGWKGYLVLRYVKLTNLKISE